VWGICVDSFGLPLILAGFFHFGDFLGDIEGFKLSDGIGLVFFLRVGVAHHGPVRHCQAAVRIRCEHPVDGEYQPHKFQRHTHATTATNRMTAAMAKKTPASIAELMPFSSITPPSARAVSRKGLGGTLPL
jgi:hypothetical protein